MQKTILLVLFYGSLTTALAQKTELKVALNANLFSFSGKSAAGNSFIIFNNQSAPAYTNNPYGSKNGFGYGLSGMIQRVTKGNFIIGIGLGYERAGSKLTISSDSLMIYKGNTRLNYDFINLQPYIGYRIIAGKVNFDLTAGIETGYCLKATEKGDATNSTGAKYTTTRDRKTIKTDVRPYGQLAATYKNAGVFVGYAYGLSNYKSGYIGGTNEAYARLLRFGITYQVKQWQRKGK
jgi:hypothetical protein